MAYGLKAGLVALGLVCACLVSSCAAQTPSPAAQETLVATGAVRGVVTGPDGTPLQGAAVEVQDTLRAVLTDAEGGFEIGGLPSGDYIVSVRQFGLKSHVQNVTIDGAEDAVVTASLVLNDYFARRAAAYQPIPVERAEEKAAYLDQIAAREPRETPNIVVIFFDDLGYGDLGAYGNQLIATPNMDRAAAEGVRLTEFYSASPVCTPSRAALLSGRYPVRAHAANHVFFPSTHPVATLRKAQGLPNALPRDEILLPEVLQRAGYRTALIGKWHLGDEDGHRPNDFGFDRFYGALYSNDMQPFEIYSDQNVAISGDEVDQRDLTRLYTEEAVRFIEAAGETPFFLYIAHTFPHVPHFADGETAGRSAAGLYGDVVEDLDRSVGAVMEAVAAHGLDETTLILITSDNGGDFHGSVGDLRGRKGEILEGGMRVPMIARWPERLPAGEVRGGMSMNIDVFPTVLSLLGLPVPDDRIIDGRDTFGLLSGESGSPHDVLFYLQAWSGEVSAARDERYKFMDRIQKRSTQLFYPAVSPLVTFSDPMLTDLELDREAHNLIDTHPEAAAELRTRLDAFRAEIAANPRGWTEAAD